MSLFKRWFGAKPDSVRPRVPTPARIVTYDVADALGWLELPNGERVRFGRSACSGFEPVVGAGVTVEELATDPRGLRAGRLVLDPNDSAYTARLAARDAAAGLPSATVSPENAAATARQLALVSVLLREPVPSDAVALRRWVTEVVGLPRAGFAARCERDLELVTPNGAVQTYVGRGTFPRAGVDARSVPHDFDFGQAFLGLGLGPPGVSRQVRLAGIDTSDGWGPRGDWRLLSQLLRLLADHATGFVLHRAGHLVVGVQQLLQQLGDLNDPECRPFAAWLDVGTTTTPEAEALYATVGMDAFGLPDVVAPVLPDDAASRARRHEAVLYAGYRMVREQRELTPGEELRVPLRIRVGAWPLQPREEEACVTYQVSEANGDLRLTPMAEPDLAREWREGRPLALNAYQALFDLGIVELVPSDLTRSISAKNPSVTPHAVEVRARHDGHGFLIITSGFGREPQSRAELAVWAPEDPFELVRLVGSFASQLGAWRPGQILPAPMHELGIAGFVLADGGSVAMGGGPAVAVSLLVPLSATDYATVESEGATAWLGRNELDEGRWTPFIARLQ